MSHPLRGRGGVATALAALALTACADPVGPPPDMAAAEPAPTSVARPPPPSVAAPAASNLAAESVEAVCAAKPELARELAGKALAGNRGDAGLAMVLAYATEAAGRLLDARGIYQLIVSGGDMRPVALACGTEVVYRGPAADAAYFRIRNIDRKLLGLGIKRTELHTQPAPPATTPPPEGAPFARVPAAMPGAGPAALAPGMNLGLRTAAADPAAPSSATAAAPRPARETKARLAAAKAAAAESGPFLVHLASYHSEKRATAGWSHLLATVPGLAQAKPTVVPVDLGAKGKYFRLGVSATDRAEADALCRTVRDAKATCEILPAR